MLREREVRSGERERRDREGGREGRREGREEREGEIDLVDGGVRRRVFFFLFCVVFFFLCFVLCFGVFVVFVVCVWGVFVLLVRGGGRERAYYLISLHLESHSLLCRMFSYIDS